MYSEDITKAEVLRGFINRNINDTGYAARVVLNTVQGYFRAKEINTKVKVIRGSYTYQMRVNMKLDKNREESYAHHAVDAMLIAFSQLGYEAYRKLQGEFIDFETGEILNAENGTLKCQMKYMNNIFMEKMEQYSNPDYKGGKAGKVLVSCRS